MRQNVSLTAIVTLLVSTVSSNPTPKPSTHWPGWDGIKYLVVFGDSYTTTGFDVSGAQPSRQNPLGNPAYPGYTATNGPNWVDFLTTTYNETFIKTINLAYGGATVDSALIKPYLPTVLSLKDQVETEYLPLYVDHPKGFNWKADNTLFASFLGINDVGNAYYNANASEVLSEDIDIYAGLIDTVYQSGARNFLFLNVPPVNRSPLTVSQGADSQKLEAKYIRKFNKDVAGIAANLSSTYKDATTFVFDTHKIFNQVLNNPCSYPETCAYKNTTDYCEAYENGTESWYTLDPTCGVSVDKYFWLNSLHPTFRMMNATAKVIVEQLS